MSYLTRKILSCDRHEIYYWIEKKMQLSIYPPVEFQDLYLNVVEFLQLLYGSHAYDQQYEK